MYKTITIMPSEAANESAQIMEGEIFMKTLEKNSTNPMLEAALGYAALGWPVIPLWWPQENGNCACSNPNCESVGKHPTLFKWDKESTTNPDRITAWWTKWPQANIGIVTGQKSVILLLDVDTKDDGLRKLAELEKQYGQLPKTIKATTGSGGLHLLFKYPVGLKITGRARFYPGLDIRSDGGMFVAAPSLHVSGRRYSWEPGAAPGDVELVDCPEWLLKLMAGSKAKSAGEETRVGVIIPTIADGKRNSTLASMAGTMRRRKMTYEAIEAALLQENSTSCVPPLTESEVISIAQSISRYSAEDDGCRSFPLTELGNAERLIYYKGSDFRYCHHWKKWLVWDDKRWAVDHLGSVNRLVRDTVRNITAETLSIDDENVRRDILKWQKISESGKAKREMLDYAKSLEGVPVLPDNLDKHPWVLNVENGELDLKTGELVPHRRENLITKLAPVTYDPAATCPTWDAVLNRIMAGNKNLIGFLQRAMGYALTGDTGEQCLFILWGTGANGKSTFLDTISALFGDDYAQNTPVQTLMARKNQGVPNDIAALKGSRFVTAIEAEEGHTMAESLLKTLTGGDKVTARFMRAEFFSYKPEFKLFLATNHKPQIRGTDNAIWRRIHLIPFQVTIPEKERDRKLLAKLRKELPGILNWALAGCLQWQKDGLGVPDEVKAATEEYRADMDVLALFLEDCCRMGKGLKVENKTLRETYVNWCESNGERSVDQKMFSARMCERGLVSKRGGANGSRVWHGLEILYKSEIPKIAIEVGGPDGLTGTDAFSDKNPVNISAGKSIGINPSVKEASVSCNPKTCGEADIQPESGGAAKFLALLAEGPKPCTDDDASEIFQMF